MVLFGRRMRRPCRVACDPAPGPHMCGPAQPRMRGWDYRPSERPTISFMISFAPP
jgi:hypothetical protein